VARSQGSDNNYFLTGMIDDKEGNSMPLPLTMAVMQRGQERYNIYCSPCHSRVGNGMGIIEERGYFLAANFHSERLRQVPLGHFFVVMTNGLGTMPSYAVELSPADRWAVASYIRALQLSQNATAKDAGRGAMIRPLESIAESEGLPQAFADPWKQPAPVRSSAVQAAASAQASAISGKRINANTSPQASEETTIESQATSKQIAEASRARPSPPPNVAMGHQLYVQKCQMCHQPTLAGLPPVIPSLLGVVDKVGESHIHDVVTNGIPNSKPPMPASPDLSTEQIDNLITFLKDQQR
jgi:mono/diheme cytochrome c family protein